MRRARRPRATGAHRRATARRGVKSRVEPEIPPREATSLFRLAPERENDRPMIGPDRGSQISFPTRVLPIGGRFKLFARRRNFA
eukprot:18522-Pelagococcus_subviridis.AAC.16